MGRQKTEGSLALQDKKVIVIEAAQQPDAQKFRIAAYARVSSDSSDQLNSFMAQTRYYTDLIASHEDWTMADLYADAGITGTSAKKRAEFQRMLSDCRKGRIDRILCKSVSRFARNTKECLETIRALKAIGVSVYFEEQNIDTGKMSGELLTAMFAAIAQKESESISGNMRWSYKQRMERGTYIPPTLPYGYKLNNHQIVIDEEKSSIIRRIFTDYLAGINTDKIAAALSKERVPCRFGGTDWNSTAVRYILTKEKYTGDSLWQKYYTTDTLPYRYLRNKGERDAYYVEKTHDPIVSMTDFQAAQELMKKRSQLITPMQNIPYPLRKRLFCGACGTVFRRKVIRKIVYWVCMGHDTKGNGFCPITQIPESEIHAAFLRMYHKLKFHGEPILSELLSNLQDIRERRYLWSEDIIELNKRISDLTDQEYMLAEMNKSGLVAPDIYISQSNALTRQIAEARQQKSRLMESDHDDSIPRTQELLEALDSMPEYLPAFDGEIFGELVDQIIVTDNNTLRFRLKNGLELAERIERMVR